MDKQFDIVEQKLNSKINTHPNIAMIWKEYLNIKKRRLIKEMTDCEKMLKNLDNVSDQSPEQMLLIANILKMVLTT